MSKLTISISLVVYQPDLAVLARTLHHLHHSILRYPAQHTILYLIDNSCDRSWKQRISECLQQSFPNTEAISSTLIVNTANTGYGHANNLAIDQVSSDYHIVLNPDVYFFEDTVASAIHYLQTHLEVGLLSPAVYGEDQNQHYLCKRNPTLFDMFLRGFMPHSLRTLFKSRMDAHEMRDRDYQSVIENLEFPSGCCLFLRTEKVKQLGGFDPRFFLYYEDADLGRRMKKIAQLVYVPDVKIIHRWTRGSHKQWYLRWITIQSGLKYFWKWGGIF